MHNEHRKLFVTKQGKWCKFVPKMHQNRPTFGGRAPPGPAEGAMGYPRLLPAMGSILLRGRREREGKRPTYVGTEKGPTSKGTEGRRGNGERGRKGRERNSPPQKKINNQSTWME